MHASRPESSITFTAALSYLCNSLVPLPTPITSTPEASGSSVPPCPTLSMRDLLRRDPTLTGLAPRSRASRSNMPLIYDTTSLDVQFKGLSTLKIPCERYNGTGCSRCCDADAVSLLALVSDDAAVSKSRLVVVLAVHAALSTIVSCFRFIIDPIVLLVDDDTRNAVVIRMEMTSSRQLRRNKRVWARRADE